MKCNGSEIVINCLKEQGVDTVFGYPGGAILNIYDALYKHPEIRHYLTSHEQGASHAADGYARATGKVGVCFATSGPGATNLVTGLATAYMDSSPVVAITANVTTPLLGKDSFQEIDICGVSMPITKYNFIVKDVTKLADTVRKAFKLAASGRKGPVLIDITKDVTAAECEYIPKEPEKIEPSTENIKDEDIEKVAAMINKAKKPILFVGGGCVAAQAQDELIKLAKLTGAAVCDTLMGKGAFPGTDPAYMGMLGMHGTKTANLSIYKCDLFIALGARFSDRCVGNTKKFANQAKLVHIDVDDSEINKNVKVDEAIVGDVKEVLKKLLPKIEQKKNGEWLEEIGAMMESAPLDYDRNTFTGPSVIETIYEETNGKATIVTDVGQHQMWAAQYYKYTKPGTFISSGGLGTMGFGLGAAIGAKVGCENSAVINITGDGCFRMNMNELATASRYDIPVVDVIINNHVLGMVRQWQTLFYGKRYSQTVLTDKVDFGKVSEGLGAKAYKAESVEELKAALKEALNTNGPSVIECFIDSDDKVFPMVPGGQSNKEVFDAADLAKESK